MVPLAAAMMIGTAGPALAQSLDVPFVPTPQDVVTKMLEMAAVSAEDIVYDLGYGDGRIVIAAVKNFNAQKGVGVDLDPARVLESEQNAREAGVEDKVTFVQGNVFDFNFSEATVLTMYLLPRVNLELRPRILAELKPGTRLGAHRDGERRWAVGLQMDRSGRCRRRMAVDRQLMPVQSPVRTESGNRHRTFVN